MLSRSSYPTEHIEQTRRNVKAHVAAWDEAFPRDEERSNAVADLETAYFTNMVLVLDAHFVHRGRGAEGKNGNPANEVRVICNSLVEHEGVLTKDTQIKLSADTSVLGLEYGTKIGISRAGFEKLAEAFLKEIETRYPAE